MKYITNSSILCHKVKDAGLIVTLTSTETITIEEGEAEFLEILQLFSTPKTYDQVFEEVNQKIYITQEKFKNTFEVLRTNNIIKEYHERHSDILSDYHFEKYKRQISSFNLRRV